MDDAYSRYSKVGDDPEVQADFARYLFILTSGYVEQTVNVLFQEFTRRRANPRIFRHVSSNLEWFQNPKAEKIAELLGSFDVTWKANFELFIDGEIKESLNSVVAIRHKVAHGESVGVTCGQLCDHKLSIYKIIDWLVACLAA